MEANCTTPHFDLEMIRYFIIYNYDPIFDVYKLVDTTATVYANFSLEAASVKFKFVRFVE